METSELRAAAERIVDGYQGVGGYPEDCWEWCCEANDFARNYLATHPTDGGEAISEEWLREQCDEYNAESITFWFECDYADVTVYQLANDPTGQFQSGDWIARIKDVESFAWPRPLTTRDDLRHLLAALGCEVQQTERHGIEIDLKRCSGRPVIAGTRFTIAQFVEELIVAEEPFLSVCMDLDIDHEAAKSAMRELARSAPPSNGKAGE